MTRETFMIVMPAYNEEACIDQVVESWMEVVNMFPGSEMVVLNDGSTDKTPVILNKLARKYRFLNIISKKNGGHGKTVFEGYKRAVSSRHPWIFQTDSDGHFNPSDFYKLWVKKDSSHFVLGYRHKRKDLFYRIALSNFISLWIFILFGIFIKDPNIPFRLMRKAYLEETLKRVPKDVFAPNIFLSILAKKDGHNLHHIPVKHSSNIKGGLSTNLKVIQSSLRGFAELLRFRVDISYRL